MLHDLRTAPKDAPGVDNDRSGIETSPEAASAYALAMKTDGAGGNAERTRFSLFDRNDRSIFFASAVMMLLPLLGGYYFNR